MELWDLVSAFGRMLQAEARRQRPTNILYDETPIHVYMQRIDDRLRSEGRVAFAAFFEAAVHKSTLIGMFLAVLELVRHPTRPGRATGSCSSEIWLEPGAEPLPAEIAARRREVRARSAASE